MAAVDLKARWNELVTFLGSEDRTYLGDLDDERPNVVRGQPEQFEELFPLIVVDILDAPQMRERASASNLHQTFQQGFRIYVVTAGSDRLDADDKNLDVCSAIINDFAGSGAYLDTDRSRTFACIVDRWSWDPSDHDDLVSQSFIDVTLTFYRH